MGDWFTDDATSRKKDLIKTLEFMLNTVKDDSYIVREHSMSMENHIKDFYGTPMRIKGKTFRLTFELEC